jgi:hypothetical protein
MKASLKHFITINNKKYFYTLSPKKDNTTMLVCEAAKIRQEFPNEDIPNLLFDLPNLIQAEKNYKTTQSEMIRFRVSTMDKKLIEKDAIQKGYKSVSVYLRDLALGNSKK